ncbi:Ig-like domain-containing protein [Prescottella sp. R16]|uniref:Ig-like domain-containing protein n=1 Tax=Prescottella sp. R16 TaxID=3064529 RepID=UPI00272E59D6|nr:Ig-like domain-containing protein [Prescottella sp. R16]
MRNPLLRRYAAPVTGVALVAGTLLVVAPATASAADAPVTTTTDFKTTCKANNSIKQVVKTTDSSVTVSAPTTVEPGETFTYRIQLGPSSYPNSDSGATTTNISRLKFDFMIPDNTTFVGATVAGSGINLDNVAPSVIRIDESGSPSATGQILRLSGNNEVTGNGPSGKTSTSAEGGIRAPKLKKNLDGTANGSGDSWFQLPAVDVTVVAGAAGTPIQPKIRTGGAAGNFNAFENFNTTLPKASAFLVGTQWADTRCSPRDTEGGALNAGAGPLATINVVAAQVSTTTDLSAPATAETGAPVALTATVAPVGATGSVQFKDNGTDIGAAVAVENGTATLNHTFESAGSHKITAVFTATGNFTGSTSSERTVTVSDPIPVDVETTLGLTVPQDAETGTVVDLTATVTPSNAQGSVQFQDNGTDIGGPVTVSNGSATLQHSFSTAGARSITAVFTGSPGFTGSAAAAQTVTVADPEVPATQTATTLSVPENADAGEQVTLSATVAPAPSGGTVQFKVAGTPVGAPIVVDGSGTASMPYTFNAAGSFGVSAVYSGTAGFTSSTATAQTVTVTAPTPVDSATTTMLSVPGNAKTGEPEQLYATVYDTGTAETIASIGTVEFFDGSTSIGTAPVVDGVATLTHTFTATGSRTITATFSGGTGFTGSSATAKQVQVTAPTPVDVQTATVLTVPATATTGAAVELSAQVTGTGNAAITGTVQFFDGDKPIGDAITIVDGKAVLNHTFTTAGAHDIRVVFSGGQGVADSTSSTQSVQVTGGDTGGNPGGFGSLGDLLGGLNFGS